MVTDPSPRSAPAPTQDPVAGAGSGHPIPGNPGPPRGIRRRGLLIGAGVGGVAVVGGAVGWALNLRTPDSAPPSAGTRNTQPATGQLPTGPSLRQYYGAGTPRRPVWKFPTNNAIIANPGAGNRAVYVASTDNNLYAVKSATGRQAWSYSIASVTAAPEAVGGVVCLSTSTGHFYALHAGNGTRAWDLDNGVPAIYKRNWAVDGGSVILSGETVPPQAYDAATGTRGVSFSTREPYVVALSAVDGILYALDALGILYAFQANAGTENWRKPLLSSDDLSGTGLTVDGGSIYVGTQSGTLYAIDAASGRVRWTHHPGNGMESDLAVTDGMVYVKDNAGTLHAISTRGKQVWARTATATGVYGPTVAGGRVYYTTALAIQSLDAKSGAPVWSFASGDAEFLTTPAVTNGLVFVGCSDNSLYAIQA